MELDLTRLYFSFTVGVAAFFNPCGFVMLPSYVSYYLSAGGGEDHSLPIRLQRGLSLGGSVSAGFMIVFAVVGVLLSFIGSLIASYLPWVAVGIGGLLILFGAWMLFGKTVMLPWHPEAMVQKRMQEQNQQGLTFYFLYGISYAIASIGCTIPIFIIVVANAFSLSPLNGLIHFLAYALGMTLMMLGLSLIMAISKQPLMRFVAPVMKAMRWVTPLILMAAGGYLIYYQLVIGGLL